MQAINIKKQCFSIFSDEIKDRFDPHYYKPEFIKFVKEIRSLKYKTKQIKDFANVICGPFGSSIKVKDYKSSGVTLIRIANINGSGKLISENTTFISKELAEKLKSYKVRKDDLIISQRGTLGLTAKVSEFFDGAIISANFIAIKNIKEVLPEYLKFFLSSKFGQKQLVRKISGQVQTKITTNDIKSLVVTIPPSKIQNQIVEIMQSAYKQKVEKEARIEKLLNPIDDYILIELGIRMPEIKEKMCFAVDSDEIKNARIDAEYNQEKYRAIYKAIKNGKYPTKKISQIVEEINKGIEVGSKAYVSDGIPFVRVADIDDYEIKYSETDKKINPSLYKQLEKDYKPEIDEILYSKDGTIGLSVVVKNYIDFIISSGILRLTIKQDINNYYIKSVLSNKIFKLVANHKSIGQIIKHLRVEEFKNIEVPMPSLEIQNKITNEVKSRLDRAKKLKTEAENIIENAKKEVEKIILDK